MSRFSRILRRAVMHTRPDQRRVIRLSRRDANLKQLVTNRIRDPRNWQVRLALGQALLARGEVEAAAREFGEAARRNPSNWPAAVHYGECLIQLSSWDAFSTWYEGRSSEIRQRMQRFSADERVARIEGYRALATGNPLNAYVWFSRVLRTLPADQVARLGRMRALSLLGSPAEARFDQLLASHSTVAGHEASPVDSSPAWMALAARGELLAASDWLERTCAEDAADPSPWYAIAARIAADAGRLSTAARLLERATSEQPRNNYLAYRRLEIHWDAEQNVAEAPLIPADPNVCRVIADTLDETQQLPEAADFLRGWSLQPGRHRAAVLLRLAQVLRRRGRLAEARAAAQEAAALCPENTDPDVVLSQIAERLRDSQSQQAHLSRLLDAATPPAAERYLEAGRLKDRARDRQGALATLRAGLRVHPHHEGLRQQERRLSRLEEFRQIAEAAPAAAPESEAAAALVQSFLNGVSEVFVDSRSTDADAKRDHQSDLCEYQVYAERLLRFHRHAPLYRALGDILKDRGMSQHASLAFKRAESLQNPAPSVSIATAAQSPTS